MNTLLGHLAEFGSFFCQGELLCTQGLAYLLKEHPDARLAFANELAARTGVTVNHDLTWRAEEIQESDGGRPDLQARISDKTPIVKVEAKLGARLDGGQLRSYLTHLQPGLQSRQLEGVLVVLVPPPRTNEATDVVKRTFGLDGPGPWRASDYPTIAITVISWDEVFAVLGRVESQTLHSELEQLEGMYRTLSSYHIWPLAGLEELINWRRDPVRFEKLVDQVTRRLTTHRRVLPMAFEPLEQDPEGLDPKGYTRRYVLRPLQDTTTFASIGVRDPFAGSVTPIWLRFHRSTGCFADIHNRLAASCLRPRLVESAGHIWIPLDPPYDVPSEQVVDALVAQAEEIFTVAYALMS